jgi:hypothetical protein
VQYRINSFQSAVFTPEGTEIDIPDARQKLHKVLSWPVYGYHDAYLAAEELGDATTVPLLIADLRHEGDLPPGQKTMECTRGHLLDALKHLTGADPGVNYADWKEWYDKNKR